MTRFVRFFFLGLLLTANTFAQDATGQVGQLPDQPNVISVLFILAAIGLLPYAVILLTSFMKIVVVMSLLRNALGVQQAPPNQVITGIALLLTIYVMFPTGVKMYDAGKDFFDKSKNMAIFSNDTPTYMLGLINVSKEPLRDFLLRNTAQQQMRNFYQTAYRILPQDYRQGLSAKDFFILIPAYIVTQLKNAFEIGVLIYLPFFVIDLVTSNILLAMGMMMLSPLTISLPLKLLLLVMVDGWSLLIQGLVMTYK
ncbi:MAG: Flagellar biosynthetic protein FliP [Chlamydiae bacterium]|nr:Flagellar biosynthetic protein FliP [Chlamydiota bacterium]